MSFFLIFLYPSEVVDCRQVGTLWLQAGAATPILFVLPETWIEIYAWPNFVWKCLGEGSVDQSPYRHEKYHPGN